MLNRELTINFEQCCVNIYMLEGFFCNNAFLAEFHNHPFTEIQIVVSGNIRYSNLKREFNVHKGQMFVIPSGVFHESIHMDSDTQIICFQASIPIAECSVFQLPNEIPMLLFEEIRKYELSCQSIKLPIYLSLILSDIIKEGTAPAIPIQNRSFLIHNFFSNNFTKEVSISDLADILCVSCKQTERLVQKYTGNTFRQEMVRLRMEAAKQLVATTSLSMTQIAEKVGYQSYSGFWKAYNAFKASSMTTKA